MFESKVNLDEVMPSNVFQSSESALRMDANLFGKYNAVGAALAYSGQKSLTKYQYDSEADFSVNGNNFQTLYNYRESARDGIRKDVKDFLLKSAVDSELNGNPVDIDELKAKLDGVDNPINSSVPMVIATGALEQSTSDDIEARFKNTTYGKWLAYRMEYNKRASSVLNAIKEYNDVHNGWTKTAYKIGEAVLLPTAGGVQQNKVVNGGFLGNILPGMTSQAFAEVWRNASAEERLNLLEDFKNRGMDSYSAMGVGGYDLDRFLQLTDNDYSKTAARIDDTFQVLDVLSLGLSSKLLLKQFFKAGDWFRGSRTAKDLGGAGQSAFEEVTKSPVVRQGVSDYITNDDPLTVGKIITKGDPDQGRMLIAQAAKDETGEVANSVFNASREDVILNSQFGKPDLDGVAKTIQYPISPIEDIAEFSATKGLYDLTETEVKQLESLHFLNVGNTRLKEIPTMRTHGINENGSVISMAYGFKDRGLSSVEELKPIVDGMKVDLRHLGVIDENFSLLVRNGDELVEIPYSPDMVIQTRHISDAKDLILKGEHPTSSQLMTDNFGDDIFLKVTHTADSPYFSDKVVFDELNIHKGAVARFFEKTKLFSTNNGQFSGVFNLFNQQHLFDPKIYTGMVIKDSDIAHLQKMYNEHFNRMGYNLRKTKTLDTLNKVLEAGNKEGRIYTRQELVGAGLDEKSIDVYNDFRRVNDTNFVLNNRAFTNRLIGQGFKVFESNGDKLVVHGKPLSRLEDATVIADPVTDGRTTWGAIKTQVASGELEVYRTRKTVSTDVDDFEYIFTRNNSSDGYVRAINVNDSFLNYRRGYFAVNYDAQYFVWTERLNKRGEVVMRDGFPVQDVVGAAKTKAGAKALSSRIKSEKGLETFVRGDEKGRGSMFDDMDSWISQSGGSVERYRGEPLQGSSELLFFGEDMGTNTLNPFESVLKSTRNAISAFKTQIPISTLKQRWMQAYGRYSPLDKFGAPEYPRHIGDIAKGKERTPGLERDIADSKVFYEYIRSQEQGYYQYLDEVYERLLRGLGSVLSDAPVAGMQLERSMYELSKVKPHKALGATTFYLRMASNAVRQFLLQSIGSFSVAFSTNPSYFLSGRVAKHLHAYHLYKVAGRKGLGSEELKALGLDKHYAAELMEFFDNSTYLSSVQSQDIGQYFKAGSVNALERGTLGLGGRVLDSTLGRMRRWGFDKGNEIGAVIGMLTAYDKWKRANPGKYAGLRDRNLIQQDADAIIGGQTPSSGLAYAKGGAKALFMFEGYTHKIIGRLLFSPQIPLKQRLAYAALATGMFTGVGNTGATLVSTIMDELGFSDSVSLEAYNIAKKALLPYTLDKALSAIIGDNVDSDWNSFFNFTDMSFSQKMIRTLISGRGGYLDAVAETAIGGTFIDLFTMANNTATIFTEPVLDSVVDKDFPTVVNTIGRVFSGFSQTERAIIAFQTGRITDKKGNIVKENANAMESVLLALGVSPQMVSDSYETRRILSDNKEKKEEQINRVLSALKANWAANSDPNKITLRDKMSDSAFVKDLSTVLYVLAPDEDSMDIVKQWINREMQDPSSIYTKSIENFVIKNTNLTLDKIDRNFILIQTQRLEKEGIYPEGTYKRMQDALEEIDNNILRLKGE